MAKHFSKKYGNKGRASNYLQSEKVMSRCLSAPDATSLHIDDGSGGIDVGM